MLGASNSTMSNALGWRMLMHDKCLTLCLIFLTNLVWDSIHVIVFFLSLLYKGSQMILKYLK